MRRVLLSLLALATVFLNAQNLSDSVAIDVQRDARFSEYNWPFVELKTEMGGASPEWSSLQMLEFFYGDFVDEAEKQSMMDRAGQGLSLASLQNWDFRFVYTGHFKSKYLPLPMRSIYIYNRSYTSLRLSEDLLRLVLFGNRATAGVEQDISDFRYESWFYTGIGHQMTFLWDTIPVSLGVSLAAVHTLDKHRLGNAGLRTQRDGSALDFNGQYEFGQSGATGSYGIKGWGLAINLETAETMGKHSLGLGIQDLGLAYMYDWQKVARDTAIRFEGLDVGSILSLEQEGFNDLLDSLQEGVVGAEQDGRWQLFPFNVKMNYCYQIKDKRLLYADFRYLFLPTYIPRLALGYAYGWENFELRSGLAYGGFNELSWDLGLNWKVNKDFRLQGGLSNLFGVAAPGWSGGTLGNFAIRYYL